MKLSDLEKETPLWKRIERELSTRLATLREQNDGDKTPDETAKLRGAIREVKTILAWASKDPTIT